MKSRLFRLFSLVLLVVLLLSSGAPLAIAQGSEPPKPPALPVYDPQPPIGPQRSQDGTRYMPTDGPVSPGSTNQAVVASTGGPDEYGYTWSDVTLAWIDASSGSTRSSNSDINLGFSFKYYENSYSQVSISRYGYVSLGSGSEWSSPDPIPYWLFPNNIIAPNWSTAGVVNGYIRYFTSGVTPNRYFVVEWNRLADSYGNEATFELILHENGDLVFQYQTMTYSSTGYYSQVSGFENIEGLDGLAITPYGSQIASNHAVRIYRPAPIARVQVRPRYQGSLIGAGGVITFPILIKNLGELGTDTYDLFPNVPVGWTLSFYNETNSTPLVDTDADGIIDTGAVSQSTWRTTRIVARLQSPAGGQVGDTITATVTARSSLNTAKSQTATLQAAIPAPFAQAYMNYDDQALSLYLVQPGAQAAKTVTGADYNYGTLAIAEAPNGSFAYAWAKERCLDISCTASVDEIEYALLNKYGESVRAVSKLTNHTGATMGTFDSWPAVAAAPNGRIGLVWMRELEQNGQYNYNIYFAVLDASGSIAYGPVNLTNSSSWGTGSEIGMVLYPKIAATTDNHFVLTWWKLQYVPACALYDCDLSDIYYAVRDTAGSSVKDITQFTFDTTGSSPEGYNWPNLATLSGNRALLMWNRGSNKDIYYAVLDSAGEVVQDKTNLTGDGYSTGVFGLDAVQLSDGKIVLAWSAYTDGWGIRFAVLDASYARIVAPTALENPTSPKHNYNVSVAADNAGHAILTWMDVDLIGRNLYYALVDGSGNILTQPMIFRTSQMGLIQTSYSGYCLTSYSSSIPAAVDTTITPTIPLVTGVSGWATPIEVNYTNHGLTSATGLVVTATLGDGLSYLGDNSGATPSISSIKLTWNLSGLNFLDQGKFTIYAGVPSTATGGTRYPVTLTITSNEPDANPSDNTVVLEVMAALQNFLPMVRK